METFRDFLAAELKDKEFARAFREERRRLRIAYEVREARKRWGLTQRQLAQLAGTTQQMVSRVENADAPRVSLRTLLKIAAALDMEVGLVPATPRDRQSPIRA